MQVETLPAEVNFSPPATLPQARSYLFKQQSELQEYDLSKGTRIRINIPRLQRSYLMKESYLRFRFNLDFTTGSGTKTLVYLDRCGAFGFFDRMEVYDYLGGTLIEQINNIPALSLLLADTRKTMQDFEGKAQSNQGFDGPKVFNSANTWDQYELVTANSGRILYKKSPDTANTKRFITFEFSIPLFSFLGMLSDKYAPLHNGWSIDLYLNDPNFALVSRADSIAANANAVTINHAWFSDVELCCQVLELGEAAESMVVATEPMVIHSIGYRHFSDLILGKGSQSNFRFDLNLNVVSLRNILFQMRPTLYMGLAYPSYGHRMRNFLQNFNFQYGSSYLPEIAGVSCRGTKATYSRAGTAVYFDDKDADYVKAHCYTQALEEVSKTGNYTVQNLYGLDYMIDLVATKGVTPATANNDYKADFEAYIPTVIWEADQPGAFTTGKFVGGLNTQLSHKNAISGIDTNGLQVCLNGTFDRDLQTQMAQVVMDVWAEYDAFVQVIPGVATTTTF